MTDVNPAAPTQRFIQMIYDSADEVGVLSDQVRAEMDDPALLQTVRAQRETLTDNAMDLATSGLFELGSYGGGSLGFAVGALGPFYALYDLGNKLVEAHEQGNALATARARDAMHLAILNLASGKLPAGFVQQRAATLGGSAHGAGLMLTQLHGSGKHSELRALSEQFVARGLRIAEERGIVDASSLALARRDPAFEADYRNNPAFQLGVDAAIYGHASATSQAP